MLIVLPTVNALISYFEQRLMKRRGGGGGGNNTHALCVKEAEGSATTPTAIKAPDTNIKLKATFEIKMSNFGKKQQQKPKPHSPLSSTSSSTDDSDLVDGTCPRPSNVIVFRSGDKQCCHEIIERETTVMVSAGDHDHGSSKVKLKNIVDYKWENKHYPGHLIAVHIDGRHIAYVINVNNKVSRMEGMIRVVNAQSGLRALIKGMSGEVLDLQFAHIDKERILASIDINSLYVHKIDLMNGTLLCVLLLKVEDPLFNYTPRLDKISWCPYVDVPNEDGDDEDSQLIVWARGSVFQCFNVKVIVADHGRGKIIPKQLSNGYLRFQDDKLVITWVALSPDGSTLGVGGQEGIIRFYQVYMHDKDPRCLHQWKPHPGKPVSSFFFLDNLTKSIADTYWKFAITGAAFNTELKVWDCGSWNCLQILRLEMAGVDRRVPRFNVEIDRTASYLVLTSLETRNCYILQIANSTAAPLESSSSFIMDTDSENNSKGGSLIAGGDKKSRRQRQPQGAKKVCIKSIAEFPLNSGILSFSIVDAAVRRYKCANENYLCDDLDEYDEESNSIFCVVLRMFVVQSKSMQECHIIYQPTVTEATNVRSALSDGASPTAVSSASVTTKDIPLADGFSASVDGATSSSKMIVANDAGDVAGHEKPITNTMDTKDCSEKNPRKTTQEKEQNALEALLGIGASAAAGGNQLTTVQTTTTTTTAVVVEVNADSDIAEIVKSRTASPHSAGKPYAPPVNLMTPDAFTASINDKNTPDTVSTEVLNTILMLASVTGQTAPAAKNENINLLNCFNNKIIEDQEHQKQQLKQSLEAQKKFIAIDNNPGSTTVGDTQISGGSSPSREVQEIMSLQDYDKSSYSGDELLLEDDGQPEQPESPKQPELAVKKTKAVAGKKRAKSHGAISGGAGGGGGNAQVDGVKSQASAATSNWPKAPTATTPAALASATTSTKHSAELQNAANQLTQAVNASTASQLNSGHLHHNVAPTLHSSSVQTSSNNLANACISSDLTEINMKMNQLIDLVKVQSMQINSLQNEIADLKKTNTIGTTKSMSEFSFKLEMQLSKLMEQYLKRYENEHKKKLAAFMAGRDLQNRELRDSVVQVINQFVMTHFGEVVSKVMTIEVQRLVLPMLSAKIDALQQQLQIDIAQKLNAFDLMVKENIAQVCKNKNVIDSFGKTVMMNVQSSLPSVFVETMATTLIPAYEKSSQHMFQQLHESFSQGIKEFVEQFDKFMQKTRQPADAHADELQSRVAALGQHLDAALSLQRHSVNESMHDLRKDVKGMELLLARQIQESIRNEMRKSFETQAVVMRSQANTPAPLYDMKDAINMMLHQGQINKAFHQALLANDLQLVEYTLKSADSNSVFFPVCCLEQKVLLSLIQQISADMSNHNEVKQNYLAEALMAINPLDSITREHAPKVLQELLRNCQMFLLNYPKSGQISNVRMLMKAAQAYTKEHF